MSPAATECYTPAPSSTGGWLFGRWNSAVQKPIPREPQRQRSMPIKFDTFLQEIENGYRPPQRQVPWSTDRREFWGTRVEEQRGLFDFKLGQAGDPRSE